ncbi:cotranscriptional regulator FAM172A homolog [Plutella xylostella]|uniref:cotranscriptional regulator FAM172A homolog n=1 Tax=Plutella xylostella TaxID=51655 RepID=UPI00203228F0|nr:cotranscriptional regulator FAM172A homolog [Plutella xylostella]
MSTRKTLKDFGLGFNSEGQLKYLDRDGNPTIHYNANSYSEEISSALFAHMSELLQSEIKLIKLGVPEGAWDKTGTCVFASKDYESKKTLLLFVCSWAGFWNWWHSKTHFYEGTQLSYIKKALDKDYGVIITNCGVNYLSYCRKKIPNSGTPEEHVVYVWNQYVARARASSVVIISYFHEAQYVGALYHGVRKSFEKRVRAVALLAPTDYKRMWLVPPPHSVHTSFMRRVGRQWVLSSSRKLDLPLETPRGEIRRVSSGCRSAMEAPKACEDSVFKFIDKKLKKYYSKYPCIEMEPPPPLLSPHTKRKSKSRTKAKYDLVKEYTYDSG